jgi:hypothetical protein
MRKMMGFHQGKEAKEEKKDTGEKEERK